MKIKIKAKTFNNKEVNPSIEFYFDGGIIINRDVKKINNFISENVYSSVKEKIIDFFKKTYPSLDIFSVNFKIISRDLENLKKYSIIPNNEDLSEKIFHSIIDLLEEEFNTKDLSDKKEEFKKRYLTTDTFSTNKDLERISYLIEDKKIDKAKKLSDSINTSELDVNDSYRLNFLKFSILVDRSTENSDKIKKIFEKRIRKSKNNPTLVKSYYFKYIKFLENCRLIKEPKKMIEEFENKYPLSMLSSDELSLYYYLKGRAQYLRGEFIVALEFLTKALENADKNNQKHIASIYNTSINSFNDNLFFQEAEFIAKKALDLRTNLAVPEREETISALGGISFKRGDFKKALEYYQLSEKEKTLTEKEKNRVYNYIFKSAIMLENYELAEKYLSKTEKVKDLKGFSKMITLLYLLKTEKYNEMNELFKNSIMLPENHEKYDPIAIAWGYTFIALSEFKQKNFKRGIIYLIDAIEFFLGDLYIMEAYYVSLYLYTNSVPLEYIKFFRQLEPKISLIKQFENYMEKHSKIRDNFYTFFVNEDIKIEKISNLELFYNDTKDINDENYESETVNNIMNNFCLI